MKKKYYIFLFFFFLLFIEIIGYLLIQIYSNKTDLITNRNYDKIREMLNGNNTVSKYWQVANLNYIPNPNYRKDKLSHNDFGFRGEKISLHHQGKLRILCLGGSTTYGTGVNDNLETYPARLQKILKDSFQVDAEVINAGLEAAISSEELSAFIYKYRYFKPDIVVLHSGGNDALVHTSHPNVELDYTDYRKINYYIPPINDKFQFLLKSNFISFCMIYILYGDRYKSNNFFHFENKENTFISNWSKELTLQERHQDTSYNSFYQNYNSLTKEIIESGAKIIHITFSYNPAEAIKRSQLYIDNIERNNRLIRQIAVKEHTSVLELDSNKIPFRYYIDDCHLDKDGEYIKAQFVAREIINLQSNNTF